MQIFSRLLKIIFYSFVLCNPLNAFVDYEVMGRDGTTILLIGDASHEQLELMNRMHAQWFITTMSSLPSEVSTKIIYEMAPKTAEYLEKGLPHQLLNRGATFFYLYHATQHLNIPDTIKLSPFDCRDKESDIIEDLFSTLSNFFTNTPTLKAWKKLKNQQITTIQRSALQINTSEFLISLNRKNNTLQEWLNTFPEGSAEYILFKELTNKYQNNMARITEMLSKTLETDIRLNIFSLLDLCKTPGGLKNKYLELAKLFCLDTDYIVTDLGFLKEILQSLKEGYDKTILVVSWAHKKSISKMLKNIGFETIDEYSIIKDRGLEYSAKIECDNMMSIPEKLLPQIRNMFTINEESLSMQQIMKTIKEAQLKTKFCNHCHNQESETLKLSTCKRCKKVFYCNRECQKLDWKLHKIDCEKQ